MSKVIYYTSTAELIGNWKELARRPSGESDWSSVIDCDCPVCDFKSQPNRRSVEMDGYYICEKCSSKNEVLGIIPDVAFFWKNGPYWKREVKN